jgi:hypothetical protein
MLSCLKVMLNVLFAWNSNKMKACHEHRKTLNLINKKALLTKKVLLHYEPTNKTETGWNKNQEALQAWSNRASYFFGRPRTCSILQLWCNSPRSAFLQKLLQKCWIVLRPLTMFAPNFFGLRRCWSLNKDDRSIGKNIPQSYFSVFARVS